MRNRTPTPAQAAWRRSRRLRETGAAALRAFNAKRLAGPRCGAKTRTTGEPCRNPALENGKCRLHGGATPKGDQWHRMQFPTKDGPHKFRKVMAKAADKQKAGLKRERRLALMTDEERAAHKEWQRAHRPGSAGERARLRADWKAAAEFRAIADRPSPPPPADEPCQLKRLAERRAQIEERRAKSPHHGEARANQRRGCHMSQRRIKRPERDEVLELVEERGLRVAIQAAIDVCEDKHAAAPARATAAGLLMRVGAIGGFGKNYVPPEPPGPLDHLSPEEYQAAQDRYLRKLEYAVAEHEAELAAQETALDEEEAELDAQEAVLDAAEEPVDDDDDDDQGGAFG